MSRAFVKEPDGIEAFDELPERLVSSNPNLVTKDARRATAEFVPPPADNAEVRFGSRVTFERADGRRQTYRIVGEDEADPAKGTLSYVSPLARALLGKSVGDTARQGADEIEILSIA